MNYDLIVSFDGGCHPNPGGRATWGVVVRNSLGQTVLESSGAIAPGRTSNNVAEYVAARMALEAIMEVAAKGWRVLLMGDSQIVVGKLNRPGRVSKGLCMEACVAAQEQYQRAKRAGIVVDVQWVRREQNMEADALT